MYCISIAYTEKAAIINNLLGSTHLNKIKQYGYLYKEIPKILQLNVQKVLNLWLLII